MKTYTRSDFAAILAAHAAGQTVTWGNPGYVLKGPPDNPLIVCTMNNHAAALFYADGIRSGYDPDSFSIHPPAES